MRGRLAGKLALVLLSLLMPTIVSAELGARDYGREIATIFSFYDLMTATNDPSVGDLQGLFGRANETEREAILRLLLHVSPSIVASQEQVAVVNARIDAPKAHASIFLACMKAAEPDLFAAVAKRRLEFPPSTDADGYTRFRVSSLGKDVIVVLDRETASIKTMYLPDGRNLGALLDRCATLKRRWADE